MTEQPRGAYSALPDPLTTEQLNALYATIRSVGPFGRVTLVIEAGKVCFVETVKSFDIRRCETWDRMEEKPK
jgi:hypothetical protein